MTYEKIIVEDREKLRVITFNQPKKKNAWDLLMYQEITRALQEANSNPGITTVALTGVGDFYSSGNDIKSSFEKTYSSPDASVVGNSNKILSGVIHAFLSFDKLLIAVVNGPCMGIAFTTAVLCDVIYATKSVSSD